MREIKFRAWNGEQFYYGKMGAFGLQWNRDDCILPPGSVYVFEQFTGLRDANGVHIHEGDIVQFAVWWFDGAEQQSILTGLIVYSNDNMSFQLRGARNKDWEFFTGHVGDAEYLTPFSELNFEDADFTVIGNIHEHPHLLEES